MRKLNRDKTLLIERIFDNYLTDKEKENYLKNLDEALLILKDEREQCVIKSLYYEKMTLKEAGKKIIYMGHDKSRPSCSGIGKDRVKQIESRTMRRLKYILKRLANA